MKVNVSDRPRQEYMDAWFTVEPPPEGLPARLGVVTACNPDGRVQPEAANQAVDAQLKCHLEQAGLAYFRVTGRSRDGSHQEPGFGIVTGDPEIIRGLSRQFRQEAFFWVEDGVVYCARTDGGTLYRVGGWGERQVK